jgi:hypothetical protein
LKILKEAFGALVLFKSLNNFKNSNIIELKKPKEKIKNLLNEISLI